MRLPWLQEQPLRRFSCAASLHCGCFWFVLVVLSPVGVTSSHAVTWSLWRIVLYSSATRLRKIWTNQVVDDKLLDVGSAPPNYPKSLRLKRSMRRHQSWNRTHQLMLCACFPFGFHLHSMKRILDIVKELLHLSRQAWFCQEQCQRKPLSAIPFGVLAQRELRRMAFGSEW